jgi:copper homeostasis protein
MKDPIILEICADSVESAQAAERGGAHRIELCTNLLEGGATPSMGLTSVVRDSVSIDVYMMIRPRGGDFSYSREELEIMERDVLTGKQLGVDGFVFGVLCEDGRVDVERTRRLVDAARPKKVTFHRAFDMTQNLDASLESVIETGADRLLTSGAEQRADEGIAAIAKIVAASGQRIKVMAGSGISEGNVRRIIHSTGVREIHASARVQIDGPMRYRREAIAMGSIRGREYKRAVVLEERVRRLLEASIDTTQWQSHAEGHTC